MAEATVVRFPLSRLVVDVERYPDDADEPMSRVGMGRIYTQTSSGLTLRRSLEEKEKTSLVSIYDAHHQALAAEVKKELAEHGRALVVDCHSFPSHPLPCDLDQSASRPDICIGTDPFHTPEALTESTAKNLEQMGYSVRLNRPYGGALVPMEYWRKDRRVTSIMLEINRHIYMDEKIGMKTGAFDSLKEQVGSTLSLIREFQQ